MIFGARERRLIKCWTGVLQIGLRHAAVRDGLAKSPEALEGDAAKKR
jgi:hypothetical protein